MSTWAERGALAAFWLAALDFCLRTLDIVNDQFGRMSPGRQILVFGELPFRDFLDPGYFLTEFSSAAMQWLFGQNLLGETLLNSVFIATGCLFVCLVARRLGAGVIASIAAGLFGLLSMPRAYDYDKVLLYPLSTWLIVRWLEQPVRPRAWGLAGVLVVASLYRFDNGVFLGIAALAGSIVLGWGQARQFLAAAAPLAFGLAVFGIPALVVVEAVSGIANAADQSITYGLREGARSRITSLPRLHFGSRLATVNPYPASENRVRVRWTPDAVAPEERRRNAARLGLEAEHQFGPAENRTFLYRLPDASPERIRAMVHDPQVEDTDGIDRGKLILLDPEPWYLRVERWSPVLRVRVLPDAWTPENGEAILYYLLMLMPVAAVTVLILSPRPEPRVLIAAVTALVSLCVLLDAFILRDPVNARVGGMAGPFAALGAYVASTLPRVLPRGARLITTIAIVITAASLAAAVGWPRQVAVPFVRPDVITYRLSDYAKTPPPIGLLPSGRVAGLVGYVRECTMPSDRVFASWFVPELFYFAQRGFGGAMSATFGGHWSEPRFQRRSIEAFEAHATPIAIIQNRTYTQFRVDYPLLDQYLAQHYRSGGDTNFGDPEAAPAEYRVLVRADRPVIRTDGRFGLPCFAAPQSL